jgi:hypothetical protein
LPIDSSPFLLKSDRAQLPQVFSRRSFAILAILRLEPHSLDGISRGVGGVCLGLNQSIQGSAKQLVKG